MRPNLTPLRQALGPLLLALCLAPVSLPGGTPSQLQLTLNDVSGVPRSKPVVVESGKVLGFDGNLDPVMTAGGGGGEWGSITGTLAEQTDLQDALDLKAPLISPSFTTPALGTVASGNFSSGSFTWPTFNQNTTGSAASLTTARTIGNVSFNGTANIVPETVAVVDSTASTTSILMVDSATGNLQPKTDGGLGYQPTHGSGNGGYMYNPTSLAYIDLYAGGLGYYDNVFTFADVTYINWLTRRLSFDWTFDNTGLHILDTDASHDLIIKPGSNITADRTLTITTGDANRTLTLSGDATLTGSNTGDQTTITGNAGTATALQTARTINGTSFDGTANIVLHPRTTSITSSATPTVNTDTTDFVTITALATAITSMSSSLSGTPANGDKLYYRIKDDGTGRAITWGASFAARIATLPTTTTASKVTAAVFWWNSVTSTWDCMAAGTEP